MSEMVSLTLDGYETITGIFLLVLSLTCIADSVYNKAS